MRKKSIEELTEELGEILKDIYETEGLEKARKYCNRYNAKSRTKYYR